MLKFYKKELVSNRLGLPGGRPVRFEVIGQSDTGVLATEDPGLIAELDKAVAKHVGGVVEVTAEQYQELKKNPPGGRSQIKSLNSQSVRQLLNRPRPGAAQAAAVKPHEPSAPMEVPTGLATISSRRRLEELRKAEPAIAPAAPKAPTPVISAPKPSVPKPAAKIPVPKAAAPPPPPPSSSTTQQ